MFSFIWMLFIGLIVGALARLVSPGRIRGGMGVTMLLGICGSFLAGIVGRLMGLYAPGQRAGFLMSTLGAIVLLWIYRVIERRRTAAEPPVVQPRDRRAA
jgi:uncharacterized membrane protein YeaQ/YmgE (transglycosylase-associated protein family)